ncbi:MAG: OST-HTH/LOTUS domain-containing protein [Chthoniobacterales bacterium]
MAKVIGERAAQALWKHALREMGSERSLLDSLTERLILAPNMIGSSPTSTPPLFAELRIRVEAATKAAANAARDLTSARSALRAGASELPLHPPSIVQKANLLSNANTWAKAAEEWAGAAEALGSIWSLSMTAIRECTALDYDPAPEAALLLNETKAEEIDAQGDLLIGALSACEVWEALRTEAEGTEFHLPVLPRGTTLAQLPEAIAERRLEAQQDVQRLIAPRLLRDRIRDFLGSTDVATLPPELLSAADWETVIEAGHREAAATGRKEEAVIRAGWVDWRLHGVALRQVVEAHPDRIVDHARRLFTSPVVDYGSVPTDALTFLSQEQLVKVWHELPEQRPALQAVLVRALCLAGRTDWWFWEPLTMFVAPHLRPSSPWQTLLHRLRTFTRTHAGPTQLRALMDGLTETASAPDPEQARQALWEHIHWARPTTDSNRYLLRQMAQQELLSELREAVREDEKERGARLLADLEAWNLDELYNRWADQLNLDRSSRHAFLEDIGEILHLGAEWRRAVLPPENRPEEEALRTSLRASLEAARHSDAEERDATIGPAAEAAEFAHFGHWLSKLRGESPASKWMADFPSEGADFFLTVLPPGLRAKPMEWRTLGTQLEFGEATWGHWILDRLEAWSGGIKPAVVLRQLFSRGWLVATQAAAEEFVRQDLAKDFEEITPVAAAEALDARRVSLVMELDALRAKSVGSLRATDREIIDAELPPVPEPLTQAACDEFSARLSDIERFLHETLVSYGQETRREELADLLRLAGCSEPLPETLGTMEEQWKKLWEEKGGRRAHLAPLRAFLSFAQQSAATQIATDVQQALTNLEKPDHWLGLSEETSMEIELHLEVLFGDLLRPNLATSENWLPRKRRDLHTLTHAWLAQLAAPDWLAQSDSPQWKALRKSCELKPQQMPDAALAILREGGVTLPDPVAIPAEPTPPVVLIPAGPSAPGSRGVESYVATLRAGVEHWLPEAGTAPLDSTMVRQAFAEQNWQQAAALTGAEYGRLAQAGSGDTGKAHELLADFAAALVLAQPDERPLDLERTCTLWHAINSWPDLAVRNHGPGATTRTLRTLFGFCFFEAWGHAFGLREPLRERVAEKFRSYARDIASEPLPAAMSRWLGLALTPCALEAKIASPGLDAAWHVLPQESKDPPVRGWLMWTVLELHQWTALERLLRESNPEVMLPEQVRYFQLLVKDREANWGRFESFVTDVRLRSPGRPSFLNFTERLLQRSHATTTPASFQLVETLQLRRDGLWLGKIRIVPPQFDPPGTVVLTLPEIGPLRFAPGDSLTKELGGPFLHTKEIFCDFSVLLPELAEMRVSVRCTGRTLGDRPFDLVEEWVAPLQHQFFEPPTPEEINRIFRNFEPKPVRGAQYIERPWDERKIQQLLFREEQPGSVWICAPRRSGKTSLLLRLIDQFGCREERPTTHGIVHFDIYRWPKDQPLSRFFWEQFWISTPNAALRQCLPAGARERGSELAESADVGQFLEGLTDFLHAECHYPLHQLHFLLDEAEKFRVMLWDENHAVRELAKTVLWQIRGTMQLNARIGLVFATGGTAHRKFLEEFDAPFFNSIARYDLKPFSMDDDEKEQATRAIIQPVELLTRFENLPRDTILHVLWATRGIPFYMHWTAGAMFAAARGRLLSPSDVNRAIDMHLQGRLHLASEGMGPAGLDELSVLEGDPDPRRKLLAKGVLYAASALLNGFDHPYVLTNDLFRSDGPLKQEAGLSDTLIRQGLQQLLDTGFLVSPPEKAGYYAFAIPLLGESLRVEFRKRWNDVVHQLTETAQSVGAAALPSVWARDEPAALRGRIEDFLIGAIDGHVEQGRELLVSIVGELLASEFPGDPVYRRLGFPRLIDLLRSFETMTVAGTLTREVLCRSTAQDLRGAAVEVILELIERWERDGSFLTVAVLGNQLRMRYPGQPVHLRLGYPRLNDFLLSLPEVSMEGSGMHRIVRRASDEAMQPRPLWDARLAEQARAFLIRLLEDAEAQDRELTGVHAGHRLHLEFPGAPVYNRLGFPRLSDWINSIGGLEVVAHPGGQTFIRRRVSRRMSPARW